MMSVRRQSGHCALTDLEAVIDRSVRVLLTSDGAACRSSKPRVPSGLAAIDKHLGTFIDITERKQAEESLRNSEARYRELADTIPAGVYEATVDGYFTYANRTAMEMYGYGEDDIRKGIHFLQVIAPEDHDAAKRRSQAVREDQDPSLHGLYVCPEGREPLPRTADVQTREAKRPGGGLDGRRHGHQRPQGSAERPAEKRGHAAKHPEGRARGDCLRP